MALAVSVLMTFNQHKAKVSEETKRVADEVEMVMLNAATNHLEDVASKDFDDATTGRIGEGSSQRVEPVTSESDLTSANRFGPNQAGEALGIDDVDDYHQTSPVTDVLDVGGTPLQFSRVTTVQYLNPSTLEPYTGSERSKMKRVTTVYTSVSFPLPSSITLTLDIACGAACQF